jgi:hypothetical protein
MSEPRGLFKWSGKRGPVQFAHLYFGAPFF